MSLRLASWCEKLVRNQGKLGAVWGTVFLVFRGRVALCNPSFPPLKGFESLRFRQQTLKSRC
jgi:hypothetical protein